MNNNKKVVKNKASFCGGICSPVILTCINVLLFLFIYFKSNSTGSVHPSLSSEHNPPIPQSNPHISIEEVKQVETPPLIINNIKHQESEIILCEDTIWCNIKMPTVSYFKFPPPTDPIKWRKSQTLAASGEQVLLKEIINYFPNTFDFLDGDRSFRRLHLLIDVFVDQTKGLEPLTRQHTFEDLDEPDRRALSSSEAPQSPQSSSSSIPDTKGKVVVPQPYNYRYNLRAPIVQIGYSAFTKDWNSYFSGNFLGGNFISRNEFLQKWKVMKNKINIPFITVCALNENWGMLSTMFPNRTAKWGQCCTKPSDRTLLYEFLDHDKTLLLAVNQHSNITHPKVLTIPRGLPTQWAQTHQMVWDAMRFSANNVKKSKLLFVSTSSWGPRPQIIHCVSQKFSPADFEGHDATPKNEMHKTRTNRRRYYEKLASSIFGLSLPGLGYDTFRMWELLTMGSIVVLEKGVGFDRTLWRLPAVLLDDFDEVTPELLRTAYIEAIYRVKDFEFERLTQSFWWNMFSNVSASMSIEPLLHKFPMEAVDQGFARPREPYACGVTNTCGPNTMRTPKKSC